MLQPISFYQSLKTAKGRKLHKCYLLEGPKAIRDVVASGRWVDKFVVDQSKQKALVKEFNWLGHKEQVRCVSPKQFAKLSDTETAQGVLAVVPIPEPRGFEDGLVLALNGVQDPGNVGTIIRTCVAMGVRQVVLDEACADPYSPKVVRSTAGAVANLALRRCPDFRRELESLRSKGFEIVVLDAKGEQDIKDFVRPQRCVLVVGAEGKGVGDSVQRLAQVRARINMKNVESLNAAVAAAIALYELKGRG